MSWAWAEQEFECMDLGDERLNARATTLLEALGNRPHLSIPAACGGRAEMQAAYRFFDNDKTTFQKVLAPHVQRTLQRMAEHPVALLVQDTSEIDLTRPEQDVAGVGELDGSCRRGLLLHVMHAFTPDGTPLGTAWAQCLNRSDAVPGQSQAKESQAKESQAQRRSRLKQTPIERKESMRWLQGLRQARAIAGQLPPVQCVCVADSEADIYECFAEPRAGELRAGEPGAGVGGSAAAEPAEPAAAVDLLIRACHDRAVVAGAEDDNSGQRLRERVLATPARYEVQLLIRGRQAKTTVEQRERRQTRQARQVTLQVRAARLTLRPPWRPDRKLPPVTVNVVLASEINPPAGEPAVEWVLVTTLPIDTLEQVRTVVEYYCVRWNIEILFRTLKSGCRVERRRLEHVDRVLPCLAMYLIVAWRTLFVCRMGRELPDADCETLLEPSEWKAVWVAVHRSKPPRKKPRLREMVHLVARLGGYVERPNSEPGPQTLWIGLQRMYDLAWAWETFGPQAKIRAT
jgi:hypothetical protein